MHKIEPSVMILLVCRRLEKYTPAIVLGLSNGLDKGSTSKGLNAAIPQTGGGRTIAKELEGVVGDVVVEPQYGSNVNDLEVGTEVVNDHGRARSSMAVELELELGLGFRFELELEAVVVEEEEAMSIARSSSAKCPEKEREERAKRKP